MTLDIVNGMKFEMLKDFIKANFTDFAGPLEELPEVVCKAMKAKGFDPIEFSTALKLWNESRRNVKQ